MVPSTVDKREKKESLVKRVAMSPLAWLAGGVLASPLTYKIAKPGAIKSAAKRFSSDVNRIAKANPEYGIDAVKRVVTKNHASIAKTKALVTTAVTAGSMATVPSMAKKVIAFRDRKNAR